MTHSNQWLQERADLLATLTEWKERAEKAERERGEAIKALSEQARLRGDAEGRLAASETAGVVEGWKARAEAAEASLARLTKAMDYYADRAGEGRKYRILDEHGEALGTIHDIGHKARAALAAMENTDES